MQTAAVGAIPESSSHRAGLALQRVLPELVALTLHAKQVHWIVTGAGFLVIQRQSGSGVHGPS